MRYLAPDADASDLSSSSEFRSRVRSLGEDGRGILVVALPELADEFGRIVAAYPGGSLVTHTSPTDRPWFTSYELPPP